MRKEMKALAAIDRDWVKEHRTSTKTMRFLIFMTILALALLGYVWTPILLANPPVLVFVGMALFVLGSFWAYTRLHFLD